MKKRKLNCLVGIFFALALTMSAATALSLAKANKNPEIVLAEDEEKDPETPVNNEEEKPAVDDANPASSEEPASSSESSESSASASEILGNVIQEGKEAISSISKESIFRTIKNIFRDAIRDLIDHFKRWFKFPK